MKAKQIKRHVSYRRIFTLIATLLIIFTYLGVTVHYLTVNTSAKRTIVKEAEIELHSSININNEIRCYAEKIGSDLYYQVYQLDELVYQINPESTTYRDLPKEKQKSADIIIKEIQKIDTMNFPMGIILLVILVSTLFSIFTNGMAIYFLYFLTLDGKKYRKK